MSGRYTFLSALMGVVTMAQADPHTFLHNPALNPVKALATPVGEPVVLVQDGKPMATVVRVGNDDATKEAAEELVEHIRLATGVTLITLTTDKGLPITSPGALILIGDSVRVSPELKITAEGVKAEGYRIQTFSNGLAIVGWGRKFGVYDFLERFVGVRWFYPGADGTIVPQVKELIIPQVAYTDQPVFSKRLMYPMDAFGLDHNDCMKLASHWRQDSTEPNIQCSAFGFLAHYYDSNPEVFQMDADGSRNKMFPCFGNPKTLELTVNDLEGLWDRNETMPFETGTGNKQPWTDHRAVHIQPWDDVLHCKCDYCSKLVESSLDHGDYSKLVAQFVADLAKEVQKRWPDKKVYYQPYMNYTAPPTGVVFPSNVLVQLCVMEGAAVQKEPGIMAKHDAWVDDWVKICGGNKIQLWEYQLWPGLKMPFQYPHVLKRFYQRHRDQLTGTFLNGVDGPSGVVGEQYAQFGPTMYVWFRLLWNPDYDVDAGFADYINQLYGPAVKPVRAIYDQMTDRWENVPWKDGLQRANVTMKQVYEETMPPTEIETLRQNLAQARALAPKGSVFERRVKFLGDAVDRFFADAELFKRATIRNMTVKKASEAPVLDGKLDDACWAAAQPYDFVDGNSANKPPVGTAVRAVWTDAGLHLAFDVNEDHMAARQMMVKPGSNNIEVWKDDSLEMFLDTAGKKESYLQFIANASGALFDPTLKKPTDVAKAKVAVHDTASGWLMEVFIPFDAVTTTPVGSGTVWFGNFCRNRHAGVNEIQRLNTQFGGHHDMSAFGRLEFVE